MGKCKGWNDQLFLRREEGRVSKVSMKERMLQWNQKISYTSR